VGVVRFCRQLSASSRRQNPKAETLELKALGDPCVNCSIMVGSQVFAWNTTLRADLWPIEIDVGELKFVILNLAMKARDALPEDGCEGDGIAVPVRSSHTPSIMALRIVNKDD
jgi:hypothetical protein